MKRDVNLKEKNSVYFNKKSLDEIKISKEEELFIKELFQENISIEDNILEDSIINFNYVDNIKDNFYTDINRRSNKRRRKYRTNFRNGKKINNNIFK